MSPDLWLLGLFIDCTGWWLRAQQRMVRRADADWRALVEGCHGRAAKNP